MSFKQNMGMMQIVLLTLGAALLVSAMAVKASRSSEVVSGDAAVVSEAAEPGVASPDDKDYLPPPVMPAEESCTFDEWVGKPVDEDAVKATGRVYRILPPGAMATMDFSPARINVDTDENGIVIRVHCG